MDHVILCQEILCETSLRSHNKSPHTVFNTATFGARKQGQSETSVLSLFSTDGNAEVKGYLIFLTQTYMHQRDFTCKQLHMHKMTGLLIIVVSTYLLN